MNLYEIATGVKALAADLEAAELDETTIRDTLEGSAELATFEDKAAAICFVLRNLESGVKEFDEEIKRLTERRRTQANNVARVKNYLLDGMKAANLDEVRAGVLRIKRQKNPVSVVVDSPNGLPAEFATTTIATVPDKTAIKAALESGRDVPGCRLIRSERIVIK